MLRHSILACACAAGSVALADEYQTQSTQRAVEMAAREQADYYGHLNTERRRAESRARTEAGYRALSKFFEPEPTPSLGPLWILVVVGMGVGIAVIIRRLEQSGAKPPPP